jgi:hypothetical protein
MALELSMRKYSLARILIRHEFGANLAQICLIRFGSILQFDGDCRRKRERRGLGKMAKTAQFGRSLGAVWTWARVRRLVFGFALVYNFTVRRRRE